MSSERTVQKSTDCETRDDIFEGEDDRQDDPRDDRPEREIGGRKGPDPTRYGDWEKAGRCIDF